MRNRILVGAGLALAIGIGAMALAGPQGKGKIAPWDAMKTATEKVGGGKAHQATYLVEGGKPIYDVIIIKDKKLSEVEVDAITGKAMAVEQVTPEEEGKEFTDELNVALGNKKAAPEKDEKDEKSVKKGKG